eukprot:gene5668-8969_t
MAEASPKKPKRTSLRDDVVAQRVPSQLKAQIGPSLLASDLANLAEESRIAVEEWGADYLHIDIMDGHFVPNLTFGPPVVKCLRKHTAAFLVVPAIIGAYNLASLYADCHLMVTNPEQWIKPLATAGANRFTFHFEATDSPKDIIQEVKKHNMECGIVIKPKTSVDLIYPFVDMLDLVLIMTVEPGFGGQSFMEEMMAKVTALRVKYPGLNIQVDGGLSPETIDIAAKAGANSIVAGSAVFKASDPKLVIDGMRESVQTHCIKQHQK